jgi:hypothetical protein
MKNQNDVTTLRRCEELGDGHFTLSSAPSIFDLYCSMDERSPYELALHGAALI